MDSEKIIPNEDKTPPSNLEGVFGEIINMKNIKIAVFLALIFLIISSEVFIKRVLGKFNGAIEFSGCANSYGVFIQSLLISISYILLDILVSKDII